MTRFTIRTCFVVVAFMVCSASSVVAGPYGDDLGKCLVRSATADEKAQLVRWVFGIASIHPAVKSISSITDAQRTNLQKSIGGLFTDLLTERCKAQANEAILYEGRSTINTSFGLLGRAAMAELLSAPDVQAGFTEFAHYLDQKKIDALGKPASDGQ